MTEDQIEAAADLIRCRNRLNEMLAEMDGEGKDMSFSLLLGRDQTVWDTTPPVKQMICIAALRLMAKMCEAELDKIHTT
jgi:hypothetical protein